MKYSDMLKTPPYRELIHLMTEYTHAGILNAINEIVLSPDCPNFVGRENAPNSVDKLVAKAKAFEELLAVFVPDTRYKEMLTTCDDDQMTGKRAWPTHRTPTIKEVREWAELSERLKQ